MFKDTLVLGLCTLVFGALSTCGVLGMLFQGEGRAARGSGWLFRTQQERQARRERRRERVEKLKKKL